MTVQELLASPERWHQGKLYLDRYGQPCNRSEAVSYCLLGAIFQCYSDSGYYEAFHKVKEILGAEDIMTWNDNHTHSEVLDLIRKANI